MSRALLIACSVILVFVLFCPIIVWSQTAPIFVVRGTVTDSSGVPVDNGLAVIVEYKAADGKFDVTFPAVTGGVSNAYLLPKDIVVGKGEFAVVFPPFKSNQAAAVGDKIKVRVPVLYDESFYYTVTQSNIDSGEIELAIPYYTFTLELKKGINLISIPLAEATARDENGEFVKDEEGKIVTIQRVSDLGKLLGEDDLIIIYNCTERRFLHYKKTFDETAKSNIEINGYTGLIVVMREPKTLKLIGKGWDVGKKDLNSNCRTHMIGIPLKDDGIEKVSNLGEQLGEDDLIIIYNCTERRFLHYKKTFDETAKSNIKIDGDTGLIVVMKKPYSLPVTGEPWSDENRRVPLNQ